MLLTMLQDSRFPPRWVFWGVSAIETGAGFTGLRDVLADMRLSALIALFLVFNISTIAT